LDLQESRERKETEDSQVLREPQGPRERRVCLEELALLVLLDLLVHLDLKVSKELRVLRVELAPRERRVSLDLLDLLVLLVTSSSRCPSRSPRRTGGRGRSTPL